MKRRIVMVKMAGKAKKIKVALGLSGGVDSAVSAYLLIKQGYDVSCVYLNCFDHDIPGCRGDNDRKDALAVAMHLGLPFRVLDFRKEYQAAVIDYFKKEYLLGRTPNPDVVCNRDIKFGLFLNWAIKVGFDAIATGHYAKMATMAEMAKNGYNHSSPSNHFDHFLLRPADLHKDQTYFLWAVPKEKFKRVLFPLGNLLKSEVREIALKIGLPVAKKKDSTGICFVGEVRVEDFLKRLGVKEKEGEVVDSSYRVIGSHRGVWFYTIGQRHGFSVDQWPPKNNTEYRMMNTEWKERLIPHSEFSIQNSVFLDRPPLYVIEKDIKKNRLIVGFGAETYRSQFTVSDINWLIPNTEYRIPNGKYRILNIEYRMTHSEFSIQNSVFKNCFVRIRHGGELIPCSVISSPLSVARFAGAPASPAKRGESARRVSSKSAGFQSAGSEQNNRKLANQNPKTENRKPITVFLSEPQRGIAPGQSAVFYSKDGTVVGGGIIQ